MNGCGHWWSDQAQSHPLALNLTPASPHTPLTFPLTLSHSELQGQPQVGLRRPERVRVLAGAPDTGWLPPLLSCPDWVLCTGHQGARSPSLVHRLTTLHIPIYELNYRNYSWYFSNVCRFTIPIHWCCVECAESAGQWSRVRQSRKPRSYKSVSRLFGLSVHLSVSRLACSSRLLSSDCAGAPPYHMKSYEWRPDWSMTFLWDRPTDRTLSSHYQRSQW